MESLNLKAHLLQSLVQGSLLFHPARINSQLVDEWVFVQGNCETFPHLIWLMPLSNLDATCIFLVKPE